MESSRRGLLSQVERYYSSRLAEHGPTARGVDWNGPESHELRHRQFLRLVDDPTASVLDLGCGFGDFVRFLRESGHRGKFVGYDIAPTMIEEARRLHGQGLDRTWHVGAAPDEQADFAIASGVFNVRGNLSDEVWMSYVHETVDVLARTARRGFGFNVLTLSSDPDRRRPELYYADPTAMLRWCLSRYGRCVALLQDYGLYEFTIIVRHPTPR